jgi:UDP-N-acetylmuramoylalanine--D-glutamate ligase
MDVLHPDELSGRKVLLMGLGSFGGGSGCAQALIARGVDLTITDLRPADQLAESLDQLAGLAWKNALGGHEQCLFDQNEIVVVNPAVPVDAPWLQYAVQRGCQLTTEVNLALALAHEVPAVAITGTHGKSSTAALTAALLRTLPGRTELAGNMGGSLLQQVEGLTNNDRLVVELSSFQLERLVAPLGWPQIAVLTCLRPDHLDRHGSMEVYEAAKLRLLAFQNAQSTLFLPANEAGLENWSKQFRGQIQWLDPDQLDPKHWGLQLADLPMNEPYRQTSLMAATAAAARFGVEAKAMAPVLQSFQGLPHRLQELPAPQNCRIIDNGVATHPEPTTEALRSLQEPISLVIGGKDKGLPLEDLATACQKCARLDLFGAGGQRLASLLPPALKNRVHLHENCQSAIQAALAAKPSLLLFSPSFASFDEFRNFADRAGMFQKMCAAIDPKAQKRACDEASKAY